MTVTLVDLDRWDPGSIRAVADAAAKRGQDTRTAAHDISGIMKGLEWEGMSSDMAMTKAIEISNDMYKHADECDKASREVGSSASEVESIKSEWSRIQHMADHWGIVIDSATGELHYIVPDDPDERAEVEHHVQVVHDAIVDLLRRADSTDQHLTSVVNAAIADMKEDLGTDSITSPQDAPDTVEKALAGNKDAAGQVESVLDSITPDQLAGKEPLTPLQASVLSQMQAQQAGLSVEDLQHRGYLLGGKSGIISDSWQLMSNPDIHFPKTGLTPGDLDDPNDMTSGGFGQLPRSVQGVLSSKGMSEAGEVAKITDLVKSGNPSLRQGTELDRNMLNKATETMSSPIFHGTTMGGAKGGGPASITGSGVQTANDVLATAGQDHQAMHDIVRDSNYSDRFMHGALTTDWSDGGKAAGNMFSWTGDAANGPDAQLAAETASRYGAYVGGHDDELLHLGANHDQTLGVVNPELTRGLSYGLAPYIPDIAELSEGRHAGFDVPDSNTGTGELMPTAKGIFSVLSTDQAASDHFNGAALADAVNTQNAYAEDFKNGVDVSSNNHNLRDSMTLKGLSDLGIHNAVDASGINKDLKNAAAYAAEKSAFEYGFAGLDAAGLPGADLLQKGFEDAFVGGPPEGEWKPQAIQDLDIGNGEHQVLNALAHTGVPIQGLDDSYLSPPDPADPDAPRHVLSLAEINEQIAKNHLPELPSGDYNDAIKKAMNATMGETVGNGIDTQMTSRYNAVTELNP